MNRGSKSSRHARKGSKNPPPPHPSPSPPPSQPSSSNSKPPRLLPPPLEKKWTADEVWALMSNIEKSWSANQFSDTPEYWQSITPFIPNSNAEKLRSIHLAIAKSQRNTALWKKDEVQTLLATVYEHMSEAMDTPEWWRQVAAHLKGRCALDCRNAYNTFGSSWVGSKQDPIEEVIREKWTLDDYMFLMKVLSRDLHVDTEDAGKMENIARMLVGKKGEEVRHLILKWRPQLVAALEKADRITGSTSAAAAAQQGGTDEDSAPSTSGGQSFSEPSSSTRGGLGGRRRRPVG